MSEGNRSSKLAVLLVAILLCISCSVQVDPATEDVTSLLTEINSTLQQARQNIWNEIEPTEPVWNMPPWLGTFFISEYYFELKGTWWINISAQHHRGLQLHVKVQPNFLHTKIDRLAIRRWQLAPAGRLEQEGGPARRDYI